MPYRTKGQHKRSHEQPSGAEGVDPCRPQGNALTRPHRASNGEFVDDVTGPSTEAAAGVRAATGVARGAATRCRCYRTSPCVTGVEGGRKSRRLVEAVRGKRKDPAVRRGLQFHSAL